MKHGDVQRKIERGWDATTVYICATIVALLCTLLSFFLSKDALVSSFFFWDTVDTGMDFFNSLAEASTKDPYVQYDTLYPPLANLLFYGMSLLVDPILKNVWGINHQTVIEMRNTWSDLRTHQTPLMLYVLFFLVTLIGLLYLIEYLARGTGKAKLFAVSCCFSYGALYGLERGNIILLVLFLTLFYLEFFESENPALREAALIALALAAGIKLYPAIFGLLLLKKEKWWTAARTVCYGILAFVLPAFAFGGFSGIREFIRCFFMFGSNESALYWSIGMDRILGILFRGLELLGISCTHRTALSLLAKLFVLLLYLTAAMAEKEKWRQCLYLGVLLLLMQTSYSYTLVFLLPALIFLCAEPNKEKWIPEFLCLMGLLLPLPVATVQFGLSSANVLDICCMGALTLITVIRQIQKFMERKVEK